MNFSLPVWGRAASAVFAEEITERGHPVRQRAKPAQPFVRRITFGRAVRATRSGGQDVRAPPSALRFTRITTLGERGCLFSVALGDRVEDRLDLKRSQIRIGLHYQSDDANHVGTRETVAG